MLTFQTRENQKRLKTMALQLFKKILIFRDGLTITKIEVGVYGQFTLFVYLDGTVHSHEHLRKAT